MKNHKQLINCIFAVILMLPLILDSNTALQGAITGVELCLYTVIPSLFPFFYLSGIFLGTVNQLKVNFFRPIGKLCKIPRGAEPIFLFGLIGGYPIGAQSLHNAYASKLLSKKESERMLCFCNQAGPAFIFGVIGSLFINRNIPFIIWSIIILSAIITAVIIPGNKDSQCTYTVDFKIKPFEKAIRATVNVCGWVILFRVIITILQRWILWILPPTYAIIITGFLELTNGCMELMNIQNTAFRFIASVGFLSFGGCCVSLQTMSLIGNLKGINYYFGKAIQTIIALLLAVIFLYVFPECII